MEKITGDEPINVTFFEDGEMNGTGLTIRQYYAGLIMANTYERWGSGHEKKSADDSVAAADALIASLNQPPTK